MRQLVSTMTKKKGQYPSYKVSEILIYPWPFSGCSNMNLSHLHMVILPCSSMVHAYFYVKILKFLVGYFLVVHSNFLNMQHLFKGEYNCLQLLRRRLIIWQIEFKTVITA